MLFVHFKVHLSHKVEHLSIYEASKSTHFFNLLNFLAFINLFGDLKSLIFYLSAQPS